MSRYLRLLLIQVRASFQTSLAYRFDFMFQGFTALFWSATTFLPLFIAYEKRVAIRDWTFPQSLLVLGFFLVLKSILEGAVNPSLVAVVEQIRQGTLDFVLLKPADAQFLVSTAKFEPSAVIGFCGGLGLLMAAQIQLHTVPSPGGVAVALLLLTTAVGLLYSIWILVISAAFHVVRVDNLAYLLTSVFDAARWPSRIFPMGLRLLFTYVIPLALMTTYPAEALLGRLDLADVLTALAGTAAFTCVARATWLRSIATYTSASS